MSKTIDFSQFGGFRLTQEQLAYFQMAWSEPANAIVMRGGNGGVPFVVSGCVLTRTNTGGTNYNYSVTDGWVFYNNEFVRVRGAVPLFGVDESINSCYFERVPQNQTLTFNDGSTPTVLLDSYMRLVSHANGTADDANKFNCKSLLTSDWQVPVYAGTYTAHGSSPIKYRLNVYERCVDIKGITNSSSGVGLTGNSPVFTLPASMWPAETQVYLMGNSVTGALAYVQVSNAGVVSVRGDIVGVGNIGVCMNLRVMLG